MYGEGTKLTKKIIDYDENSLYLYCSVDTMPYGKNTLNEKQFDQIDLQNVQIKFFGLA